MGNIEQIPTHPKKSNRKNALSAQLIYLKQNKPCGGAEINESKFITDQL